MPELSRPDRSRLRRIARAVVAAAATLASAGALALVAPAGPAWAAAAVSVVSSTGGATADPEYSTPVTVTGSGFQSIAGGFGGVYVLFGWVDDPDGGSWRPSRGGQVGSGYRYVPDQESKDNAGFQRFVAFPGSDTADAANAVMSADGSWSVDLVIPAARFESADRNGKVTQVDCLDVQCGVLTIGAHGVKNANNETFTPIEFSGAKTSAAPAPGVAAPAAPTGPARVGYTGDSVAAGNVLSFTGQGFTAGEQVLATLDDGVAAVGPLTAGSSGEVAGVLAVPADLRAGTHVLVLTGAASGAKAETEVTVTADPDLVSASSTDTAAEPAWPYLLLGFSLLVMVVLLVLSITTSILRGRRARRGRRSTEARDDPGAPAEGSPAPSPAAEPAR